MELTLESGTPAFLAQPSDATPTRGVVVIPDIMGLRPLFTDLSQQLADDNGWAVCCYELYPGNESLDLDGRFAHAPSMQDDRVLGDAVLAAAATRQERVAIIGFCMGGMYALKAVSTQRFDRSCPFYGMIRVPEGWRGDGQGEPLELIAEGSTADVLAIIGEQDPYTPPADVEALRGAGANVVVYPEAEHGFVHDDSRPSHRADDAADAWRRVTDFIGS